MTLLDAERLDAPAAGGQTPGEAPAGPPVLAPGEVACGTCGAGMAPDQDWCLSCGAAATQTVERPGWRAFASIAALTLLLVLGAVAASFAAHNTDKRPPAVASVPAPAQAVAPAAVAPAAPVPAKPAAKTKLPKVKAPSTAPAAAAPVAPTKVTPAPSTPGASAPARVSTPKTATPTSTPRSTPAPAPVAPVAIKLDPSAGSTYDPFGHAAATGEASRALDGTPSSSWYLDPKAADGPIGAGYAINLGKQRGVKRIELTTTTPGFRVEVYATDEATPPPDIGDTRWSHITNVSGVGAGSGTQTIVVGGGTSKYQTVLLWITARPSDGARVRISELKLFG